MQKKRIAFLAILLVPYCLVFGSFYPLPKIQIDGSSGGEVFLRKLNREGKLEVRSSVDFSLHWDVKIEGYSQLFSIAKLTPDGKHLVYVFDNHQVYSTDDIALIVYSAKGIVAEYKVGDFVKEIYTVPEENKVSVSPDYIWFLDIVEFNESGISFKLIDDRYAFVSFIEKGVREGILGPPGYINK